MATPLPSPSSTEEPVLSARSIDWDVFDSEAAGSDCYFPSADGDIPSEAIISDDYVPTHPFTGDFFGTVTSALSDDEQYIPTCTDFDPEFSEDKDDELIIESHDFMIDLDDDVDIDAGIDMGGDFSEFSNAVLSQTMTATSGAQSLVSLPLDTVSDGGSESFASDMSEFDELLNATEDHQPPPPGKIVISNKDAFEGLRDCEAEMITYEGERWLIFGDACVQSTALSGWFSKKRRVAYDLGSLWWFVEGIQGRAQVDRASTEKMGYTFVDLRDRSALMKRLFEDKSKPISKKWTHDALVAAAVSRNQSKPTKPIAAPPVPEVAPGSPVSVGEQDIMSPSVDSFPDFDPASPTDTGNDGASSTAEVTTFKSILTTDVPTRKRVRTTSGSTLEQSPTTEVPPRKRPRSPSVPTDFDTSALSPTQSEGVVSSAAISLQPPASEDDFPELDTDAAPEADAGTESGTESATEKDTETQAEAKATADTEGEPDTEVEADTGGEAFTEAFTEVEPDTVADTEVEADTGVEAFTEVEPDTAGEAFTEVEPDTVAEPDTEVEADTAGETFTEIEADTAGEAFTEVEADTGGDTGGEADTEGEADTGMDIGADVGCDMEVDADLDLDEFGDLDDLEAGEGVASVVQDSLPDLEPISTKATFISDEEETRRLQAKFEALTWSLKATEMRTPLSRGTQVSDILQLARSTLKTWTEDERRRTTDPRRRTGEESATNHSTHGSNAEFSSIMRHAIEPPRAAEGTRLEQLIRLQKGCDERNPPVAIIILPNNRSAKLNMLNVQSLFNHGRFEQLSSDGSGTLQQWCNRKRRYAVERLVRNIPIRFEFADDTKQFKKDSWMKVVAVVADGQDWQFKDWPFKSHVDLFAAIQGYYINYASDPKPASMGKWNIVNLSIHKLSRHEDPVIVDMFWRQIEDFLLQRSKMNLISFGSKLLLSR